MKEIWREDHLRSNNRGVYSWVWVLSFTQNGTWKRWITKLAVKWSIIRALVYKENGGRGRQRGSCIIGEDGELRGVTALEDGGPGVSQGGKVEQQKGTRRRKKKEKTRQEEGWIILHSDWISCVYTLNSPPKFSYGRQLLKSPSQWNTLLLWNQSRVIRLRQNWLIKGAMW